MRDHIEHLVAAGAAGDALPSIRELTDELSASPVTIVRAIGQLAARGLVHTEPGKGTFITAKRAQHVPDLSWQPVALSSSRIDPAITGPLDPDLPTDSTLLSWGYLGADLQPRQALRAAASRTVRRGEIWEPAPAYGIAPLRNVFAADLDVDPGEVLVTQGSQAALSSIFRTLAAPGDAVVVENPTYPGALAAAQAAGLRSIPVPTDPDGVRTDFLDEVLARSRAKLVYLQTAHANPTGATLAPRRRREVLDIARSRSVFVVDDQWARHLTLEQPTPQPLIAEDPDGHVIHLTSLSKSIAPSLRIGYLSARGPALQRLHGAHVADELFVNRPLQEIALEFLTSPDWPRHLKRVRRRLTERRDHLRHELSTRWPGGAPLARVRGGYHFWVPLPPGQTSTGYTRVAAEAGIVVGDGATYFTEEPPAHYIRMSYGAGTEPEITRAVGRLVELLRA